MTRWTPRVMPRDVIEEAVDALLADRLRSVLAVVGIVVGVATVVTALAIGEGARRAALADIGSLGLDNVFVRAVAPPPQSAGARRAMAPLLSLADVRAVGDALPVGTVVSAMRLARVEARAGNRHAAAALAGVTASWQRIAEPALSAGRWLTAADEGSHRRVAIVGGTLARDLFAGASPIGERIHAGGDWYAVVGVLHDRSVSTPRPALQTLDLDRAILVPLGAMLTSLGAGDRPDRVQEIGVRAAANEVDATAQSIAALFGRRHPGAPVFELVVPRELLQARLKTERTFSIVLIAVGILALTISGVGVMNIMLANVAVRVGEIGVRRAFGARHGDILAQFTIEALALCVAGGAAGVPIGAALSALVAVMAGWPVSTSPAASALALLMSAAVGLGFGVYPAMVAARIAPIDALRAL